MAIETGPIEENPLSEGEERVLRIERLISLIVSVTRYPETIEIIEHRIQTGQYIPEETAAEWVEAGYDSHSADTVMVLGVPFLVDLYKYMNTINTAFDHPMRYKPSDSERELVENIDKLTSQEFLVRWGIDSNILRNEGRELAMVTEVEEEIFESIGDALWENGGGGDNIFLSLGFQFSTVPRFPDANEKSRWMSRLDHKWNTRLSGAIAFMRKLRELDYIEFEKLGKLSGYSEEGLGKIVEYASSTADAEGAILYTLVFLSDKAEHA
ncbi:MAG TPA: hypothetical protein ENI23_10545, partial [bacterium]|nr:hypothetical protein [bacterium]